MNLPEGPIGHDTKARVPKGPESDGVFLDLPLDPSHLVLGKNSIAVELHQCVDFNADLSFDMELVTGVRSVQDRIDSIDEDACLKFLGLE